MIRPLNSWTITSPFGNRVHPITGDLKFHNGIDLSASVGTPIFAPDPGKVDSWLENSVGGKQMIIQHDNGMRTGYAHLNERVINKGSRVNAGDIIAYTGKTGAVTGAHLHFNMKDASGQFIDPATYSYGSIYMLPEFTLESTRTYYWLIGLGALALGGYTYYRTR